MTFNFITPEIKQQKLKMRYRQRICCVSPRKSSKENQSQPLIQIKDKTYLNFSSNDYLGLNNNDEINKAMQEGIDRFGLCSSGSSLVTGFNYAHQSLEDIICQWQNMPRCLLFSSGFAANVGVLQALASEDCYYLLDKLSHASIIEGAFSSKAKVKTFRHNDIEHVEKLLNKNISLHKLIISEGVFSMDGDQADVSSLVDVAKKNNAKLFIDDAHSIGVIGYEGQGSASIISKKSYSNSITMATFGKAIATSGAFITCDEELHDYLINFSRHYIYSTAISPAMAWATKRSIELIQQQQWRRDKILCLSHLFTQLLDSSIDVIPSQSSIHALIIGSEQDTLSVSDKLRHRGIWVTPIRPPTVKINKSRLRVTICANHKAGDIRYLASTLNELLS